MDITNKRVVITGAASGFGKAIALDLLAQKAKVATLDVNEKMLQQFKDEQPGIFPLQCDVTNTVQVDECIVKVMEQWEGIDVLINNAGIMKNAPLINLLNRKDRKHSLELWQKVIDINQTGVFNMARSVAEQMVLKRNKGVIINISSIAAQGNIGQTAYSASKAAVEAMSKVWSKELGRFGIRSVAIAPGFMDTAGTAEAIEEKMLKQWIEKTPLRRTGSIDEVVSCVNFVLNNDFINGETINVNGGLTV
ncbi:MAG: SDR family oxidoreductase [Bacteroidales bacterium]|nr:SDR family oxidoreductase [Bacteroidales bacterium]